MAKTVIGTFSSRNKAEDAIEKMRSRGFSENEISLVGRGEEGSGGGGQGPGGAGGGAGDGSRMQADGTADGVGWGAGLGAGAGLLASAGALAIPGVGPILAMGPLAATLSGAVTGGIAGGLLDFGIPEERGRHFESRVKEGHVLCVVKAEENKAQEAAELLRQFGAQDVETHEAG